MTKLNTLKITTNDNGENILTITRLIEQNDRYLVIVETFNLELRTRTEHKITDVAQASVALNQYYKHSA